MLPSAYGAGRGQSSSLWTTGVPLGKYELPGHIQRLRRKNTHRALKPEAAPAGLAAAGAVTPHVWQVWDGDCSGAQTLAVGELAELLNFVRPISFWVNDR